MQCNKCAMNMTKQQRLCRFFRCGHVVAPQCGTQTSPTEAQVHDLRHAVLQTAHETTMAVLQMKQVYKLEISLALLTMNL